MKEKVIIGMSGGVDSSVSAWLLLEQGYAVEGLFMKNWEQDDRPGYCAAEKDLQDAQQVCNTLGIPLHTVNFSEQYWDQVFQTMLDEYAKGRTPNPDVLCNREIKFSAFLAHAKQLGADKIATGHYARVEHIDHKAHLFKSKDKDKDQTYFLHAVPERALAQTLFPLGDYFKSEVREFAKQLNLSNHDKKDSTGLCFIGERRFKTFLNEFLLAKPGLIKTPQEEVIGEHDGLMFYTLGQRQGLKIGGKKDAEDAPWYVVDKDIQHNVLYVAQGSQHPLLYAQGLICGKIQWINQPKTEDFPMSCCCKTRYRQPDQACMIAPEVDGQHTVLFSDPQRAVTPGQSIVFYHKHECLGGAVIEAIIR